MNVDFCPRTVAASGSGLFLKLLTSAITKTWELHMVNSLYKVDYKHQDNLLIMFIKVVEF